MTNKIRAMRSLRSAVLRPFGLSPFRSQAEPAATIAELLAGIACIAIWAFTFAAVGRLS